MMIIIMCYRKTKTERTRDLTLPVGSRLNVCVINTIYDNTSYGPNIVRLRRECVFFSTSEKRRFLVEMSRGVQSESLSSLFIVMVEHLSSGTEEKVLVS